MKLSPRITLRIAIVGSWICLGLAVAVSFWEEQRLPPSLFEYLQAQYSANVSPVEMLVGLLLFVALVVASVGLLALARWSRPLFLFSTLAGLFLWPVVGPNVEGPWEALFHELSLLGFGFVIALSYFGEAKKHFVRRAA
ncbi:MAG: hypothetical protein WBM67_06155 [Sedimenticolaceae bacterium]